LVDYLAWHGIKPAPACSSQMESVGAVLLDARDV